MRIAGLALSLCLGVLAAGCASIEGFPERVEDPDTTLAEIRKAYFLPDANVMDIYNAKTGAAEKQDYRNEVIANHMRAIDIRFGQFVADMNAQGNISNLSLDFIGVTSGAVGAAVTGATASRILSALSTVVAGERTSIDKNLYFEKTLPALFAIMEAERAKIRLNLLRASALPVSDLSLTEALSLLEQYYYAGTLPGAIAKLTSVAGDERSSSEQALTVVRDRKFLDQAARERVDSLLTLVGGLTNAQAIDVLANPPSPLDGFVDSFVKARLGGNTVDSAEGQRRLSQGDNAKNLLKSVVVLIEERSEENVEKWTATVRGLGG